MNSLSTFFSKFIEVGFTLAICLLSLIFYLAYVKMQELAESPREINRTQQVRFEMEGIISDLKDAEIRGRGFMITGDSMFIRLEQEHLADAYIHLDSLDRMVADKAYQQPNMAVLRALMDAHRQMLEKIEAQKRATLGDAALKADLLERKAHMEQLRQKMEEMMDTEMQVLESREREYEKNAALTPKLLLLLFYMGLLALVLSYFKTKKDLEHSGQQLAANQASTNTINGLLQAFRYAEEIAQKGHWERNLKSGKIVFSDNIFRLLGCQRGEFDTLQNFLQYVHPDDHNLILQTSERITRDRVSAKLEFRVIRKNGQQRYFRANTKVVVNAKGDEVVLGIMQDVTEEKLLRREVEERTQFLETLIENSPNFVAAYDKNLNIIELNKQMEQFAGIKKEEVLGKNFEEVFPHAKEGVGIQSLHRALAGEYVHMPVQGSNLSTGIYESFYIPLRQPDGEIFGALAISHDITEPYRLRQQLEERTRFAEQLIDSSVDMIAAYDANLCFTAWNLKCEQMIGIPKEKVIGKHLFEVFPYIRDSPRLAELEEALKGRLVHTPAHQYQWGDWYYEANVVPITDENGAVTGVLTIAHDVTEAVKSAAELENLNKSLEEKNRELARSNDELASFSYVASHDLQEPLRKIRSFADLILRNDSDRLSESGADAFKRMQAAAGRMQNLIEDLLAYSRLNTTPVEFENVELEDVLETVKQDLSEAIKKEQAVIESVPLPKARVIQFQFRQLLTNLIGNAVKYRKPDVVPHIRISCETVNGAHLDWANAQKQDYIKLVIADNGIGFDPEYSERIFGLFQRLHGRSQYSGTGIGLTICKKIIENHEGRITATGERGEGAVFTVCFPA